MEEPLQAILAAIATIVLITFIYFSIYFICRTTPKHQPDLKSRRQINSVAKSQLYDPSFNQIEMSDLLKTTRNFSPDLIVGDGSFGLVYKAELPTVALKKLGADAFR